VIRENLARTGFADRAAAVLGRVGRWRAASEARYTLVFADPPYDDAPAWVAIERTLEAALAEDATVAVEHAARVGPPEVLAGLGLWRDRRQGEGAVAIYRGAAGSIAVPESSREDA
jgi:16S rRNA G966 N2-methylase RsmD